MAMIINVMRRAAFIGLSAVVALPVCAETNPKPQPGAVEFATLEKAAVFEINANSGSLKESIQNGQELIWRRKENQSDEALKFSNISIALIRNVTGGQVNVTFSSNISSLGYLTADEVKLNMIVRAKGGASLHSLSLGVSVNCVDNNQSLTPLKHEIPKDIAGNVFANASTIEISEYTEPKFPGLKVRRCR
jgi:hypothetical protein